MSKSRSLLKTILYRTEGKKAVLLDLDNTLYTYLPCHRAGLQAARRFYSKEIGPISPALFAKHYNSARDLVKKRTGNTAASHSRLLYFQYMLEKTSGKTVYRKTLLLEQAYWNQFLASMKLRPWVLPFLRHVKKAGKKTVIVTDLTARIQLKKISRLKLEKWIDFVVSSEEAGTEKPHPAIFKLAFQKAGCRARDAVLIGDHPERDRPPRGTSLILL